MERALRKSERRYRALIEEAMDSSNVGIFILNYLFQVVWINSAMERFFGIKRKEVIGKDNRELIKTRIKHIFEDPDEFEDKVLGTYDNNTYVENFICHVLPDSQRKERWLEHWSQPIYKGLYKRGRIEHYYDITERIRAEKEKERMEEQLRQAQKMEAIGALASGIAHDFNNILTIIKGNTELLLMDIQDDDPDFEVLQDIKKAVERGSNLVRQILTFSRKGTRVPEVIDLNQHLKDTEKLIRRALREDIELKMVLAPSLWKIYLDTSQVDQIIMNLVINARDAMPDGGTLTIETANVELDSYYFKRHGIEKEPGKYVMLAVTDTGIGMDESIKDRIFDPFFTTKERTSGTGLGLSTVYGIVKQNNGYIWCYSEPGKGTTMKVYLPRIEEEIQPILKEEIKIEDLKGTETVLVIEDEDMVRDIVVKALKRYGYNVISARDGKEAIGIAKEYKGDIHLILTDVIMPGMHGKDVVQKIQSQRPNIKVIYMSGYTENIIMEKGILPSDINYIQKPFSSSDLVKKVRKVLSTTSFHHPEK